MRRAKIDLYAVAAAFAEGGPGAVSADDLAAAAGVAKPTLYARHRSKDELYLACLEAECERLLERLWSAYGASTGRPLEERLASPVRGMLEYAHDAPAGLRLLFGSGRPTSVAPRGRAAAVLERIHDHVAEQLRRELTEAGRDPAVSSLLAHALLGLAVGVAGDGVARSVDERAALAQRMGRMLAHGLRAAL